MEPGVFVVTGAARPGYGEAVTRRLLKEGHRVLGTYDEENATNAADLRDAFADGRLVLSRVDHGSRGSLGAFVEGVTTTINGIVHGEFMFAMEDPERLDYKLWERSLAVNLTAPNYLTRALSQRMADGSAVAMVTSTEGFIGSFGASAYAATKAAIHNLVKSLANTMGHRAIRVNAVAAGWIGGVMDTDEVFNMSRRITPLGRLGTADEVASVVCFLLSDQASFVNGTTVVVDGGYTCVDTIAKYEYDLFRAEPTGAD